MRALVKLYPLAIAASALCASGAAAKTRASLAQPDILIMAACLLLPRARAARWQRQGQRKREMGDVSSRLARPPLTLNGLRWRPRASETNGAQAK